MIATTAGTTHPMLLELGRGGGSIHYTSTPMGNPVTVKVYPHIMHTAKALYRGDKTNI